MKKLNFTLSLCAVFVLFFAGNTGNNNPNQFDCVGTILKDGKECGTCVLIGSKYVLSSATLFVDAKTKPVPLKGNPSVITYQPYDQKITNVKNIQVQLNGKTYACKKLVLYPEFRSSMKTTGICNIAILILQNDVQDISPAPINTNLDEQHAKEADITEATKNTAPNAKNLIDSLCGYGINGKPSVLYSNMNMPLLPSTPQLQSDGVLFVQASNGWQVAGIAEADEFQFGAKDGSMKMKAITWTRVSVFADWINKVINDK